MLVGKVGSWKCFYFWGLPSAVFVPLLSAPSHLSIILVESMLARTALEMDAGAEPLLVKPSVPLMLP